MFSFLLALTGIKDMGQKGLKTRSAPPYHAQDQYYDTTKFMFFEETFFKSESVQIVELDDTWVSILLCFVTFSIFPLYPDTYTSFMMRSVFWCVQLWTLSIIDYNGRCYVLVYLFYWVDLLEDFRFCPVAEWRGTPFIQPKLAQWLMLRTC